MADPSHVTIIEWVMWALGGAGAVALAFLGIWWKVEGMQNKKIDELKHSNHDEHQRIHTKIDSTHHDLNDKIDGLRDKVEDIWKHLVRRNGGKGL